jgi:hypothetical protein
MVEIHYGIRGRVVILGGRGSEFPSEAAAVGFVLVCHGHKIGSGFLVVVEANNGVECRGALRRYEW